MGKTSNVKDVIALETARTLGDILPELKLQYQQGRLAYAVLESHVDDHLRQQGTILSHTGHEAVRLYIKGDIGLEHLPQQLGRCWPVM